MIWQELGMSFGTSIIVLIALYFVIKHGVKNGIEQYFDEKEELVQLRKKYPEFFGFGEESITEEK